MKFLTSILEAKITDKEINEKIEQFRKLQNEIAKIEAELKVKKKEFGEFDVLVQPILSTMKETGDKLGETDKHLIKVTRFGYESMTASYKKAYDLALTKVNDSTKKILEAALEETKGVRKVKTSYSIDTNSLDEFNIKKIIDTLKKSIKGFLGLAKKENKNIDSANKDLEKLAKV